MAMVRPTKAADFRSLSNEEIETEIYESRSEILQTRIKQQKKQVLDFLSLQLFCLHPLSTCFQAQTNR